MAAANVGAVQARPASESPLHVPSEIGRLRRVCLHRPGEELLNLMPADLGRLLFDDIPFLEVLDGFGVGVEEGRAQTTREDVGEATHHLGEVITLQHGQSYTL